MLELDGRPFCTGRSTYADQPSSGNEPSSKIFVKIEVGGLSALFLAQLDTGAAWSVLDPEIASLAGVLAGPGDPKASLRTWQGEKKGHLIRHTVTLLADQGESIDVDATFFVPTDPWPIGRCFLGYNSFLDSVRTALDPQVNQFYFGPG